MGPNYRMVMRREMGSMTKATPCIICSGRNNFCPIHHHHLSTAWYNRQMTVLGEALPMCHFCDTKHAIDKWSRQNVILSDSTLSGVQYLKGWGWGEEEPLHCDLEAVPGGKIETLSRVWLRAYFRNPLPIDTVLVAGLNDIKYSARPYLGKYTLEEMAEKASEDIMNSVRGLHRVIVEHGKTHMVNSTLAVATVLHVPALYWHQDDGPTPSQNYVNYKGLIDTLNNKIKAFNMENGASAPELHQAGERSVDKAKKRKYMFQSFREVNKANMMHLTDSKRMKMVKTSLVQYFRNHRQRQQGVVGLSTLAHRQLKHAKNYSSL